MSMMRMRIPEDVLVLFLDVWILDERTVLTSFFQKPNGMATRSQIAALEVHFGF